MSTFEDTNNKIPRASSPTGNKCVRHHNYYYEDGSAVFQTGTALFKLQASLLKADPDVEGYRFEAVMKRRLESPPGPNDDPGSSDSNPIILPLPAFRFELFLMAILGRVKMPAVTGAFTVELQPATRTPIFLLFYLATGHVASYFGMKTLVDWAWQQVRVVLESSESIAAKEWPHDLLDDLAEYIKTNEIPEFQHELLGMMQLILSRAALGPQDLLAEHRTANLLFCVNLYKTQTLATSNPALFGSVFVAILSLGHCSPFWIEHLTRDDRTILYAAYGDLTRLSGHDDLEVKWLAEKAQVKSVCLVARCSQTFDNIWNKAFAQGKRLDSAVPLEDIAQILTLPKNRFAFAKECSGWKCQSKCAQNSLEKIDIAMRETFCGFTKKHEAWTR